MALGFSWARHWSWEKILLMHPGRGGFKLLSEGDVSMGNFMIVFLGVFYGGQATAQIFMFSSRTRPFD